MNTRNEEKSVVAQMSLRGRISVKRNRGRPKGIPQGPKNGYGGFDSNNVYRPELFVVKDRDDAEFCGRVQKFMKRNGWKRVDAEQLRKKGGKNGNER